MLGTMQVVRIVISRLAISEELKHNWLLRRAIMPPHQYTKREFRNLRRQLKSVIDASVVEMNTFIANNDIAILEANYHARQGEAPVDHVFHIVNRHMFLYLQNNTHIPLVPPELRRTCTGYFGASCSSEDVALQEWELQS